MALKKIKFFFFYKMKNNDGGKNVSLASLGYSLANWTYSAATDEASYFK